ncbi:hypothetical protein D0T49_09860 [Paludibacter sp. 221]|uniref:glycosyltransferase n=1 Tax=Paludibacter sp. 221 TaxID=2302939 RepID=UPI0013D70B64|nr:glycosyltransferase [Paludibacter sp. 221]NDV47349.1 hypothetical protein [Paludibacter sp. 221]
MRILIYRELALPPAYIPRVRYFCSYLLEKGWEVDLVTEASDEDLYVVEGVSVLPVKYYKYKSGIKFKIEWGIKTFLSILCDYKGRYFYKKSKDFFEGKQYDMVFCSSCFTFPLTTAAKTAKRLNVPLFVDLRDIAEQSPDDNHYLNLKLSGFLGNVIVDFYKKINVKRRNKVLRIADGVTTVSPWHVQTLLQYNPNTHLIYNGFDENVFVPEKMEADRFTISYFGRVYNEKMRNPRLLYAALRNLKENGVLSHHNTVVKWFIDEQSKEVIRKITEEYGLKDFIQYYSFVEPDKLLPEMNKSSILLVLCNIETEKRYFGIMTTKFFEAIGVNRPVLCIPDNRDNLSKLIKDSNSGLVSSDVSEVENFLQQKFLEWKQTGHTNGTVNETVRMDFSRRKGAEILEKLFLSTLKK